MVLGLVGSVLGAVAGSLFDSSSSKSQARYQSNLNLSQSKKLYDYTSKGDFDNWLKQWNMQTAYQDKYLSNSAKATQNLNQKLMDYQYALERQSRQSSFQDTRKDLESAGYNPLLAVGQQSGYTSVGSGVSTESAQVENAGIANSAVQSMATASGAYDMHRQTTGNLEQIASDILGSRFTNDLHSAQSELVRSQTRGQDIQNLVDNQYKADQALANLDLTKQQKLNLKQDLAESQARILKYSFENTANSAQTALYNQESLLNEPFVNFTKKHPVAGGTMRSGASNIFGGLGTALLHGLLLKGRR